MNQYHYDSVKRTLVLDWECTGVPNKEAAECMSQMAHATLLVIIVTLHCEYHFIWFFEFWAVLKRRKVHTLYDIVGANSASAYVNDLLNSK